MLCSGMPKRYADLVDKTARFSQSTAVGGYPVMAGTAVFPAMLAEAFLRRRRIVV